MFLLTVSAYAQNLLVDPGFELQTLPSAGGWISFSGGSPVAGIFSTNYAHTGHWSMFDQAYLGVPGTYEQFPASPGEKWRLTGYGLTPVPLLGSPVHGQLQVSFRDIFGNNLGTVETAGSGTPAKVSNYVDGTATPGQWIFLDTGIATAPAGTAYIHAFTLYVDFSGNVQGVYFDDLNLTAQLPLTIMPTNRAPTTNEIAPPIFHPPPTFTQLEVFTNGVFTTNVVLNPNVMTIVLTHGWIPLYPLTSLPIFTPNGVEDWPATMAAQLHAQGVAANIVAWNWEDTAKSSLADPKRAGSQSPGEGFELGMALFNALGPNYSKPIHFIGHSFGTLVNSYAANYLQGTNFANEAVSSTPWPATNMQMTLFDEAEVGADQNFNLNSEDITLIEALMSGNGNSLNLNMPSSYYHPLPRNFAWADNYVSAFGLLHTNAANVILTDGFPTDAPDPISLLKEIGAFHGYPQEWYDETIETDISAMGFLWSFERGGWFSQAPSEGSVYVQASNNSPWNLTPTNWNYGTNFLVQRFQKYDAGLGNSTAQFVDNTITADGTAIAQIVWDITTDNPEWLVSLETTVFNSVTPQVKVHPLGLSANDESSNTNIPAYAWMQLIVPTNAISMSFNYIIQGDWKSDSLAAAFKGTNVLLIVGNTIQTNVTFSSGSIDVSTFAGQTNEFFVGIVGGTSTNAQLTVENLAFSISSPPLLQAQPSGNNFVLTWPLSAADYTLENSTDLVSWTTNTDVSAIVNLQNTITNSISGGARFYRLKK